MRAPSATRSLHLTAAAVRRDALDPATIEAMWTLFEATYTSVTRAGFDRDLAEKDSVILCRDTGDGSVQGFSTLKVMERTIAGQPVVALFSGDTVVSQDYWGQHAIKWRFFIEAVKVKLRHPRAHVYWFLISKGYRTYLMMSRNFPHYWPRHDAPTPAFEARVMDELATERFGPSWHRDQGVLEFVPCPGRLREDVAPVRPEDLRHPDIRFFHERNPRHAEGVELCCLAPIDLALATSYPAKVARRLLRWAAP